MAKMPLFGRLDFCEQEGKLEEMTKCFTKPDIRLSCECESCQSACTYNPGWFLPGEAEKATELMGLTFVDFFEKYLGVNWYEGSGADIFLLAPAITNMETGTEYPGDPRGTCIFFESGKCQIHNAKPHECRESTHENTREEVSKRHKDIAVAWDKEEHQEQVRTLLGREPKAESFWISGYVGLSMY